MHVAEWPTASSHASCGLSQIYRRRLPQHPRAPLPFRSVLTAVFVPSVNLPDFMTSAKRELMFSADFFCARCRARRQRGLGDRRGVSP